MESNDAPDALVFGAFLRLVASGFSCVGGRFGVSELARNYHFDFHFHCHFDF